MEEEIKKSLSGSVYKRVVLDEYMDKDGERKSYRVGEQFCDIYYGRGTKRVRAVEVETMPVEKRARVEVNKRQEVEMQAQIIQERRQYAAI